MTEERPRASSAAGRHRTRLRPREGRVGGHADEGVVPAELGGSDAPREMLDEDPELESGVLGRTTGSDEPATESGIDLSAGDQADATTDGGNATPPEGVEPDTKDIGAPTRQPNTDNAAGSRGVRARRRRATASSSSAGRSTGSASRATSGSSAWPRRAATRPSWRR